MFFNVPSMTNHSITLWFYGSISADLKQKKKNPDKKKPPNPLTLNHHISKVSGTSEYRNGGTARTQLVVLLQLLHRLGFFAIKC